jgi:predicted GTPase
VTGQDARVASPWERGRALVLVANKWDAVAAGARDPRAVAARIDQRFPSLAAVPNCSSRRCAGAGWARLGRR